MELRPICRTMYCWSYRRLRELSVNHRYTDLGKNHDIHMVQFNNKNEVNLTWVELSVWTWGCGSWTRLLYFTTKPSVCSLKLPQHVTLFTCYMHVQNLQLLDGYNCTVLAYCTPQRCLCACQQEREMLICGTNDLKYSTSKNVNVAQHLCVCSKCLSFVLFGYFTLGD